MPDESSNFVYSPEALLVIIGGSSAVGFKGAAYVYVGQEMTLHRICEILLTS
jgi:hypothetical protein